MPAEVITAVWGLESDFGAIFGKFKILPSLATLAYDCRRGDHFRNVLVAEALAPAVDGWRRAARPSMERWMRLVVAAC